MDDNPFAAGPSLEGPLSENFSLYGTNANADSVLWGKLDLEDLPISPEIKAWLEELVHDHGDPRPTDVNIKKQHFQDSVQKCNEDTSTSPSGFDYIIWKACGLGDIASDSDSKMMSLSFTKGYPPSWWKRCLEVMLEKDKGNPMIHRLQIIVLL